MKLHLKRILQKTFVRNVLVMATGTAAAQAVTMALSPIITRMYGPEAFGIMGTFNAMISIIVPVSALTFPIAIVLPKSNNDAKGLIKLSLMIAFMISVISLISVALFNDQIVRLFNLSKIESFLYLFPLIILFSGLMQVSEQWLIRTKQFTINARVTFYQSIITNGSKVGLGYFYPLASVLVVITALGNGIKAFLMIMFARKANRKMTNEKDEKANLKKLAKEYYDFPLYRAPETFLNAISHGVPVLMLTAFFGPATAGYYTIGMSVLSLPSQLVGKSVGDVFYPRIAEAAKNHEDVTGLIRKATFALGGIGIIPFGIVILFGPTLFAFVFGNEWDTAGEYARWISLWSLFAFMNRPSVHSLPVLNAMRFHLIYTIIMLITRLSTLGISYYMFSDDLTVVALFGISGAVLNFVLIFITLQISKKKSYTRYSL